MKPHRFHRQADAEFTAAAEHYAKVSPALGQRFYLTIHELVEEICAAPTRYRFILPPARRHFRLPFPYAVIHRSAGSCLGHRRLALQTRIRLLARAVGVSVKRSFSLTAKMPRPKSSR